MDRVILNEMWLEQKEKEEKNVSKRIPTVRRWRHKIS